MRHFHEAWIGLQVPSVAVDEDHLLLMAVLVFAGKEA